MENIRNFVETIKGIQTTQIIDIGIAILIYILFRCLSRSLAYMTVKIFKPKTRNKKLIRKNAFYTPLRVFYVVLGIYVAFVFLRQPLNTGKWLNDWVDKLFKISIIILAANGIANSLTTNNSLVNRLKDKMIHINLKETAKKQIIEESFDPNFGARPIKRYVTKNIETLIAKIKEYKSKAVTLKRLEEQALIREFGYYSKREFKKEFIINVSRVT